MRIEYIIGDDYQTSISSIARWEIDGVNEKFRLIALDGTILAERNLYDDIRRIVFLEDDGGPTVDVDDNLLHIKVFPNPAQEMIYIEGLNEGEIIRLFSLDGQLLISQIANASSTAISVNSLSNGIYLIQVDTEIVKFIKQ